ncbi:hypothetical protein B9Z55_028611 [Caenorhabditis nigoni]|uniref:Uncharacterized protein n=1 Tax=Caenorhabditis nigoni TaxID=1611254 RepID=A0A2G5SAR0_9PELO|nr:hypothetical protein B9Z55_028611 [Caenorhabditis nigoni]
MLSLRNSWSISFSLAPFVISQLKVKHSTIVWIFNKTASSYSSPTAFLLSSTASLSFLYSSCAAQSGFSVSDVVVVGLACPGSAWRRLSIRRAFVRAPHGYGYPIYWILVFLVSSSFPERLHFLFQVPENAPDFVKK